MNAHDVRRVCLNLHHVGIVKEADWRFLRKQPEGAIRPENNDYGQNQGDPAAPCEKRLSGRGRHKQSFFMQKHKVSHIRSEDRRPIFGKAVPGTPALLLPILAGA
jgi:hypothetical protein